MLFDPECIPCIAKQAYNSAKLFTNGNKEIQFKIINEVCSRAINSDENLSAPMFSKTIQSVIEKYSGIENPYAKIKEENIKKAEKYFMFIKLMIEDSNDRIETAMRAAIIGNVIDYGANPDFDIDYEMNHIVSNNIDLSALPKFKENYKKADTILYIGDNYEEAFFDKFLINELLPKKIVFAVRSKPILNDITLEDAKKLGIDKLCTIIESGSTITGMDFNECTQEFLDIYHNADLVITKGQGNYETMLNETRPIYFLFKVKCEVIARKCGYPVGKGILLYNQNKSEEINETL